MTWASPDPLSEPLRFSDHGPGVERLQFLLFVGGDGPGRIDGLFGPKTLAALRRAQGSLQRAVTGIADPETLAMLRARPRLAGPVERVMTPCTWAELAPALARGFEAATGRVARREVVLVAGGALAEEHGANYTAVHLCNLGNQQIGKALRDAHGRAKVPWFSLRGPEVIKGADEMRVSPYPAYADIEEGAQKYFERLRDDYAPALVAFETGDPDHAARELKRTGCFTGNEDDYAEATVSRFKALSHASAW